MQALDQKVFGLSTNNEIVKQHMHRSGLDNIRCQAITGLKLGILAIVPRVNPGYRV